MSVNIGPRIGIDGEAEYRKQIQAIIQETKTLKSEYKKLSSTFDKGHQSLKQNKELHEILGREIEAQERRVKELSDMVELSAQKFGEADPKTLKWKEALNQATTQLNNLNQEMKDLPSTMELIGQKMEAVGGKIQSVGGVVSGIGRKLAPVSAAAAGILVGSGKSAVDFETAMVGVQKTIDGTAEDFNKLGNWIKQASTEMASSKTDIAGVMEIAGQLGVSGVKDLEDFTKTMVMLGDTTNLSSDEAATALARFMNITGTSYQDSEKLGSAIVALGNNFATSESEITEMSTRLAAAGTIAGLSETDILALAASMSSVGINAEAGGTAMTQTLQAIDKATAGVGKHASEKLIEISNIAGMSAEQFSQTWKTKPIDAINAFIAGLGRLDEEDERVIAVLGELDMAGIRQSNMLQSLALASDMMGDAVKTSNEAWDKNVALQEEADKKYGTTASKIQQAKEKITNVAIEIGERLLPYVDKFLGYLDDLIAKWDALSDEEKDTIIDGLITAAASAPVIKTLGDAISGVGGAAKGLGNIFEALGGSDGMGGKIAGIASGIGGVITFVSSFVSMLQEGFNWIDEILMVLGAAVAAVGAVLLGVPAAIAAGVAAIGAAIATLVVLIKDNWDAIVGWFGDVFTAIGDFFVGIWDWVCDAFSDICSTIGDIFSEVISGIGDMVSGIGDFFIGVWEGICDAFSAICSTIGDIFTGLIEGIGNLISGIGDFFISIWNGICSFFSGVCSTIGGFFSSVADGVVSVWTGVCDFFSSACDSIGGFFSGLVDGIGSFFSGLADGVKSIWDGVCDFFSGICDSIGGFFSDLVDGIGGFFSDVADSVMGIWDGVGDFFGGLCDTIGGFFGDLIDSAVSWGADLIDSFIEGIVSMFDSLIDTVSDIGSAIADFLGFSEPKKGPLSNFHTYAPDMMELFAEGIRDNESVVQNQIAKSFDVSGLISTTTIPAEVGTVGSTANNNTVSIGDTRIIINATDGQSAEEIAERVSDIINARIQMAEAAWA